MAPSKKPRPSAAPPATDTPRRRKARPPAPQRRPRGDLTSPSTVDQAWLDEVSGRPRLERSTDLVHVPDAERTNDTRPSDDEIRLGDVDEWGRSERMRTWARRFYDPLYRRYFRVEWEGLDKIPTSGGALLVANHAGAIPADAPAIMHGIETELGRPVYGLADHLFRRMPVIGTMWSRVGGVPAHPDNAYRLLHDQGRLVLVFPRDPRAPES
ncbi:MAG: 1-acyl-sn-glycerol-3-phosphate acyltransferase [Microthrixaceae bacterium]